jgi:hypothetical protein
MVQLEEFGCECIGPDKDTGACYIARVAPESLAPKLWMGRAPKVYSNLRVFEARARRETGHPNAIRDSDGQNVNSQRSFAQ